jgi:hypothetical protein
MKNQIYIIWVVIISVTFCSCNNREVKDLKIENKSLQLKIDSLENWLSKSFDPVVIEDNKRRPLREGDTANFVLGLLMNDELKIDTIEMSLFKISDSKTSQLIRKDLLVPKLNKTRTHGTGYFTYPNLSPGNYFYDGYIKYKNQKIKIYHYLKVADK